MTRNRNKKPKKHGKKLGEPKVDCRPCKLVAWVEYEPDTPAYITGASRRIDNVNVKIEGVTGWLPTVAGERTFEGAPRGAQTVAVKISDITALDAELTSFDSQPAVVTPDRVEQVRFVVKSLRLLKLTKVDPQFASSVEDLDITYDIRRMSGATVEMQVVGWHGEVLHKVALSGSEKADGSRKPLKWTGAITVGPKAGRFACPLDGPFKVQLLSPGWPVQELRFNILYAKLELDSPPWADLYKAHTRATDLDAPAGDPVKMRAWVAYKLNELGFWAGPPDGTDNNDLKLATRCFRLAHPELCGFATGATFYEQAVHGENRSKQMVLRAGDALFEIDAELQAILEDGSKTAVVKRTGLSNPGVVAAEGQASKLFVDNSRFHISEFTEFNAGNTPGLKYAAEQAWISRPHLPVRCLPKLLDKANAARAAPAGLGKVPILWCWADEPEADLRAKDLAPALPTFQPDAPSRGADYIGQLQADSKPGTRHGVNTAYGGLLDGTDADALAALVAKAELLHERADKPGLGVFTRASMAADRPEVLGTPVVYLHPSNIAGDCVRVSAALHLDDEPNMADIEPLHRGVAPVRSGLVAVWRRMRIAAYVAWPPRAVFDLPGELAKVKAEFALSLVDLDTSACEALEAQDVFEPADFDGVIDGARTFIPGAVGMPDTEEPEIKAYLDRVKTLGFSPNSVYPGNPELCETPFHTYVNRLVRTDSPFARTLAQAWADHAADPDVQAAGRHFVAALTVVPLVPLPDPVGAPIPVTAAQIEQLLLPKPVRDEFEAYAAERSLASTNTSALMAHLVGLARGLGDGLYVELLIEQLQATTTGRGFKPTVARLFRADPLDLRKWVIRRRVGRLAGMVNARLGEATDRCVRKTLAVAGKVCDGAILLDYATSESVDIRGVPFVVDGVAFGGINGVALLDRGLLSPFASLAAHELGHCMFLQHWRNAPTAVAANHDQADDNCTMSYPVYYKMTDCSEVDRAAFLQRQYQGSVHSTKAHYCWDVFKPHFCGRCSLQIRGWKLEGGRAAAPARVPVAPRLPVAVKLVRDTPAPDGLSAAFANDDITTIGISFYPPNLAGKHSAGHNAFRLSALADFPRGFGDSLEAALDPASFRVEVTDPNTGSALVYVTLEALRPIYSGGSATGWAPFDGEDRKQRALVDVECAAVGGNKFRSRYIRLVVDEYDHAVLAGSKQGLLVSDMVKPTSPDDDDAVEILDQKIRVWYDPA